MKQQGRMTTVASLGLLGTCLWSSGLQAAPVEFTIDPTRSTISISGTVVGNKVKEQGPGSLTTSFSGVIKAEVSATSLQFTGGSLIQANNNGSWQPLAAGASGNAPANFGGKAESILGSAVAALRNIQLDVTSPALTLVDNGFDSAGLLFQFLTNSPASMDYLISSFFTQNKGSEPLAGYSTNQVATRSTLVTSNGVQVLTIPVSAGIAFSLLTDNDSPFNLQGQWVATRPLAPAGTDISISSIQVANQQLTLQWTGVPGQKYTVESTVDLETWTPSSDALTAGTTPITWSTNLTQSRQFFRIGQY